MHAFASAGADVPLEDQDAHEAQSHIDNAFASPSEGDRRTNSTELFMTRPASVATSNSTPTPGTSINGLEDVHSSYIGMPVEGQDPASFKTPLKPFDRSTFEATFLQHSSASNPLSSIYASSANISSSAASTSSSSSTSEASTTPAQTPGSEHEDPFFYPLLCENERKRLREFWYLTSGIHDDKALATHLRELLAIVRDLYKFDIAVIQFIDNDRSSSLSPDGWQEACCPRRETACAHTMLLQPGTVLTVSDFLSDERFRKNKRLVQGQVRSYAGAPLAYKIQGTGETISLGSLCVFSFHHKKPPLTPVERESLGRFADLALHAIKDRSRLRREHIQTRRHEILSQLSKVTGPASTIVEATLEALNSTLGGKASFLQTSDGSLALRNVGRVPYKDFEGGVWENVPIIEDFIRYHNHESSLDYDPDATVRAIAVPVKNVNDHFLLVETGRLRDIYDGTDTLFVQSCAMVIASSIQDGLLRQALEAKSAFLRNAQHAFRTSLNGVLSATDMLIGAQTPVSSGMRKAPITQNGTMLGPSITNAGLAETTPLDLLRIIETSGRGLLTVINHLIDLDAQTVEAKLDVCDIHDVEEEVLDSIVQHSSREKMKDILLISDSRLDSTTGDCIITDRLLLRQTIAALVQNAVEATSTGGTVRVTIRLSNDGATSGTLEIEVRDTGMGIKEEDHDRIFQPFEKVNTFTPNAGLGLSFACQYAATLGASVSLVHSAPGVGSTFLFRLPNPVLASSLKAGKTRKILPKNWTFWMYDMFKDWESEAVYRRAFQSMGMEMALCPAEATLIVQTASPLPMEEAQSYALQLNQVLLTLGWDEEDTSLQSVEVSRGYSKVSGRLPWTRNRLIANLLQAQRIARQASDLRSPSTPVEELSQLTLQADRDPNKVRALLVDDNAMNLNILQAYCKKRRYDHRSARDGHEAYTAYVAACEAGRAPSVCLLDLQMPVCDGIACASMIRGYEEETQRPRCPIIMVTAQSGDTDRLSALKAGADAYYVKPLRISTLDDIMARYALA